MVEVGDTYAILDVPEHPAPGETYVGITDDSGQFVLDGGLPHYDNGGITPVPAAERAIATDGAGAEGEQPTAIEFLGTTIGPADGAELPWESVGVFANGTEILGLSFFLGRDTIYAKLICPEVECAVGESVEVSLSNS